MKISMSLDFTVTPGQFLKAVKANMISIYRGVDLVETVYKTLYVSVLAYWSYHIIMHLGRIMN